VWLLFALRAACNAALLISKAYLVAMSCGVLEYLLTPCGCCSFCVLSVMQRC
jgi:hypothetical protein